MIEHSRTLDASPPQQIVRKALLTAAIEGRKDVARVEIKEIDFAPSRGARCRRGFICNGTAGN